MDERKIALFVKRLIVGISAEGSVNLLRGQLRHFKTLGYETYLMGPYSQRSSDFCKQEGCTHLIVPVKREISPFSDLVNLFRIICIYRKVRPDIINLGTPKISLLGMIAGKLMNVKTRIYTCRGFRYEHEHGTKRRVLIAMEKLTSACAQKVICISHSVRALGLNDKIFSSEKSVVIHKGSSNGVDLELFNRDEISSTEIARLRTELRLEGKFVYGFVGRIVDRKGVRQLYDAFNSLYERNHNIALLIVGPFEEAQLTDKKLISDIKSHEGIRYPGRKPQQEVPLYLALTDVFVLPAWWEGFGNVLIQAAAMGIPVISTTATGTCDAVHEHENGILIPPKSVDALRKAMQELYENKVLYERFSANGLPWAKNFDSQIIWKGLQEIYETGDLSKAG